MTPEERLQVLAAGQSPQLIARMPSGFAVMGDTQFLRGYCLLLAYPMVEQLLELPDEGRNQFLKDMASLGEAVKAATGCRRVNFSIYGNLDPFLHAHVWPRYDTEPTEYRTMPPFSYPAEWRNAPEVIFSVEEHGGLLNAIRSKLRT